MVIHHRSNICTILIYALLIAWIILCTMKKKIDDGKVIQVEYMKIFTFTISQTYTPVQKLKRGFHVKLIIINLAFFKF